MTLDEAMKKYRERFGEQFPLYCTMGMDDGEIVDVIEECLREGEPFELDDGVLY